MPKLVVVERDYGAVAEKMGALGPLLDTLGATTKGVTFELGTQIEYLRHKNGTVRGGVAAGRPSLARDVHACEAILALSGTTNGHLAVQGFKTLEKRTGRRLADLAQEHEGKQVTFADTQAAPVTVITSPEWSGSESGGRRYSPFTINVERLKPWHTLTGRQHFFLDHDWMSELGENLPVFRPPLNMQALFGEPQVGNNGELGITVRYLTPHNKWSIHSEYQDNLLMLSLSRGGPTIWMSSQDAAKVGVKDNDWIEAVNRNGVVRRPGDRHPPHAGGNRVHVPRTGPPDRRPDRRDLGQARRRAQLAHAAADQAQPPHRRVRPAVLRVQLPGPDREPARRGHRDPAALPGGAVLMRVMAQMSMVMNLDKCIGCHTCSVTCKQAWTNRTGVEYVWFNNVETRPGQGYPRTYQDQEKWLGGWTLNRRGRLKLKAGGRLKNLASIFSSPKLPSIQEYYEPWTYDYEMLTSSPLQEHTPVARPKSLISGKDMKITWSANWDDNLAGAPELAPADPILQKLAEKVKLEFEETFMFYLPRICEHCLNPACAASCPSGAIYKRSEDGIVLVDQDKCRGWRKCVTGCPYKKIYFNHRTGKAEKCTLLLPPDRGRAADGLLGDLRRSAAVHRPRAVRRGQGARRRVGARTRRTCSRRSAGCSWTPTTPRSSARRERAGIPRDWVDAAQRSPVWALINRFEVALPLHPEYRTMPMVWYIPPLSPVVDVVKETAADAEDTRTLFAAIEKLRIPVAYLAELFSAGDPAPVEAVLRKLAAMRVVHAGHQPRPRSRTRRSRPRSG